MRNWGAKKDLTLPQQFMFLKSCPIAQGVGSLTNRKLTWRYQTCPTPLSRMYSMRIEYMSDSAPDVFVEEPDIALLGDGRELPHVYHNPLRLCLYLPGTQQWLATKRIDLTIVPWTVAWLYYYEEWLVSDDWKGGGKHPDETEATARNRKLRRILT